MYKKCVVTYTSVSFSLHSQLSLAQSLETGTGL